MAYAGSSGPRQHGEGDLGGFPGGLSGPGADQGEQPPTLGLSGAPESVTSGPAGDPDPGVAGPDPGAAEPNALPPAAPRIGEQGRYISGRYLLEQLLRAENGADLWRAMDEKLNRAVAVYVMPPGTGQTAAVVAAARAAAAVPDTRFLQVLDAVDDGTAAYVVTEWLPDAVDLATALAAGPLPAWEAVALAFDVAEALACAHGLGLTHLRLDPRNVLTTQTGQVKIHGLRLEAALEGEDSPASAEARVADVRGVGALLYAGLTARWPGTSSCGLPPAPLAGPWPVAPSTLNPAVGQDSDPLVLRLLAAGAVDGVGPEAVTADHPAGSPPADAVVTDPIGSCEDAAAALAHLRRTRPQPVNPPTPKDGLPLGEEPRARGARRGPRPAERHGPGNAGSYGQGRYGDAADDGYADPRYGDDRYADPRGYADPRYAGPPGDGHGHGPGEGPRPLARRAAPAVAGVLVLAGLGLLGTQLLEGAGSGKGGSSSTATTSTAAVASRLLPIKDASLWQSSLRSEHGDTVRNTITGEAPAWTTSSYRDGPKLAQKPGTGIIYDLGSVQSVSSVSVEIGAPGATLEMRAAEETVNAVPPVQEGKEPPRFRIVASQLANSTSVTLNAQSPVRTRFVLVWFTALPRQPVDGDRHPYPYYDSIVRVRVYGRSG